MPVLTPDTLTVAAYDAFAPISWSNNGEPAGRDIAFLKRFAAQQGLALRVRFFPTYGDGHYLGTEVGRRATTPK